MKVIYECECDEQRYVVTVRRGSFNQMFSITRVVWDAFNVPARAWWLRRVQREAERNLLTPP